MTAPLPATQSPVGHEGAAVRAEPSAAEAPASMHTRLSWRSIPWIGGVFIVAISALAAYDIVRGYQANGLETARELDTQARVIAEQTARSMQAVDLVLRHIAEQRRTGALAAQQRGDLHAYLKDQAIGLVQSEGLMLFDSGGKLVASSQVSELPDPVPDASGDPLYERIRSGHGSELIVDGARRGLLNPQIWVFPIVRRLQSANGSFAGAIVAGGRVEYFQQFYRDVRLDSGTTISLLHRNGSLLARHPAAEAAMGQRFPVVDNMLALRNSNPGGPMRSVSPIDGVDRFGAIALVPEQPLAVVVTRDADMALAGWRQQTTGTIARTLALAVLAALLLAMVRRQFLRLDKTRASLELSRERFALAAAGSDEGIWDWDVTNDRVYASARAREIFGLQPGPDKQPREEWFAAIRLHPDDVVQRNKAMQAHMNGRTPVYEGEYRVWHSGNWRWVRVRGLCVRNASGTPLRMAGSVTDIDARRRGEDALRLSEERYALAMAGLTGGHWVWETETDALFVSDSVHQLFGLPLDTTVSTRTDYFRSVRVHPDDWQGLAKVNEDVVSGAAPRIDYEFRILLPGSSTVRWILTRAQSYRDAEGKVVRVAGVSVDITERKHTEQALRLSEERFALAVAGSHDGLTDWDVVNDRMYASERTMEMLGIDSTVTTRTRAEWVELLRLHPDDQQRHSEELRAFLASDAALREGEYRVRRSDGNYRWVRLRNLCVRAADGRPLRLAGSVSDIDAYKRVEAALRQSEERYALSITGSDEGHWVWDIVAQDIFVSERQAELFEFAGGAQVMSDREYFARLPVHPDDRALVARNRNDHVAGKTPQLDHEFRVILPSSGETRWIHTRAQCFRDADGKPLRLAGSTVDATRRKQAEEALRTSEQRFALAVLGSDDGVWDFDYVNNRVFGSRRAREILGVPLEPEVQSLDEWFTSLQLHPDDAKLRESAMQAHLNGLTPAYEGEWRVWHPAGHYRWVRVRGMCVRDAAGKPQRMAGSVSDIDARKRAEESLRLSEERYELAVAGSDDGVWDWDLTSGMAFESARARELQGLAPGPELQKLDGLLESLRVHPEDASRRAEAIRAHLAGDTPAYECEYRVRRDDGQYRWIRVRALCTRDANGKPYRMAGSVSDADDRKQAEEALRLSRERFELAVAGSNDGILDWDIVNDRMFASPRALKIIGAPPSPTLYSTAEWKALLHVHPDDASRQAAEIQCRLDGDTEMRENDYRVLHADGQYRWVRVRGSAVAGPQGKAIRWAGSLSDIDEQKRTEEALRRSEERYQLAVAGSNEGLWDWDLASDLLFLSPRAQQLTFVEAAEPLQPRQFWIAKTRYHPDDIKPVRRELSRHLRGETPFFVVEYRVQHHSGAWHWYRQRGIALRDDAGKAYRMAGSMEDITQRKNAEGERDRLEAQLRQAQKLEAIGTLAGGIAHDFNNILAAILGYGEMAQKDAADGSAQRRHIDAAISAGMRAKSLVERILAFSRSGMGERVPVHVQSVVVEALDQLAGSLPAGITLQQQLDAGDAAVLGDPTQVHQVVMNLCANAVQAMKSRGTLTVTLDRVQLSAPRCSTSVLPDGAYVRLSVRDTGTGMSPQLIERIFDPFFTTKEVGVGTGLGLSLVHGIVADLGGGIDVDSKLGEGSTFTVFLPWRSTVQQPETVQEIVVGGDGETVLLVDDEEALVRLGEEMIAGLGYEPVGFTSSTAALEAFRASPARFDAVLSDEAMPDMTGSELAREIRAIRGDIPIVLMSGYVTPALTHRARDAGVLDVLAKPLVARDIARSLADALQQP